MRGDKAAEFGIQWQGSPAAARATCGLRRHQFQRADTAPRATSSRDRSTGDLAQGLNAGIINGTVTIAGLGRDPDLAAIARALEPEANANILSTPNLIMLDNEEAKIVVGQNVPFITGQYTTTAANPTCHPFQTIERKDVGITLRVRPQITEDGSVRLDDLPGSVARREHDASRGIITDKRSIESSVAVEDGQIVVLGGLIQDQLHRQLRSSAARRAAAHRRALPLQKRQRTKTNLMIFISAPSSGDRPAQWTSRRTATTISSASRTS